MTITVKNTRNSAHKHNASRPWAIIVTRESGESVFRRFSTEAVAHRFVETVLDVTND